MGCDRHDGVLRQRLATRREMEQGFVWPTRELVGIVLACVGTMLIRLSVRVPWLGIVVALFALLWCCLA